MNRERRNFQLQSVQRQKKVALPYTKEENTAMLNRFINGPNGENKEHIHSIDPSYILNTIKPEYSIGFIGDIMDLVNKDLIIGDKLKHYLKNVDFLVGNFEGTIIDSDKFSRIKGIYSDIRHKPQIMDALETLFPPENTFLSVANNHAGDFGRIPFFKSLEKLNSKGFHLFGTKKQPYIDLNEDIRVIGGTVWSNRPCDYIINLYDSELYIEPGVFNILFPHWDYEYYLYPSSEIIELARHLIENYNAIIGHHSHCPQPISFHHLNGYKKLLAYCLGDFCVGKYSNEKQFANLKYGIVLKIVIGRDSENQIKCGEVNCHFIKSVPTLEDEIIVKLVNKIHL